MMRIGRYNVVSVLGHGAYGEVFHAQLDGPMGFRKDVALKRLHPHLVRGNAAVVQALIDEARLGGLLRHPNIVESHEFEQDDGTWFLAMEFIDGVTLQDLASISLEGGQRIPASATLEIIEQICRGLEYAHTLTGADGTPLRIVHRDLKPANLMLSREGVVKIMDFGMAKAASNMRDSTASGTIKGTPSYMSPEQVHATRAITEASDLYSVGIMFYELLLGRRLFEGETAVAVMFAVIHGVTPEQVAELEAAVPGAGPIFARCTAAEPADRWRSSAELGQAVSALRDTLDEPPDALRALAVALLQGPSRLGPDERTKRSSDFRSYLDSVHPSFERVRSARAAGSALISAPTLDGADATRDAVGKREADATRDAAGVQDADATRDARGVLPLEPKGPTGEAESRSPPPETASTPDRPETRPAPRGRFAAAATVAGVLLITGVGAAVWTRGPPGPGEAPAGTTQEGAAPTLPEEAEALPPVAPPMADADQPALPISAGATALPSAAPTSTNTSAGPPSDGAPPNVRRGADAARPAPDTPQRGKPRGAPADRPGAADLVPAAPLAAGEGTVLVKSSPWGRVSIDGSPAGQTPLRRKLPAGKHVVTVDCGECATPATRTFDVTVAADGLDTVTAEFAK